MSKLVDPVDAVDLVKIYLLAALMAKDRSITHNGHALLKEAIMRRDKRLFMLLRDFELGGLPRSSLANSLQEYIERNAHVLFMELFKQCPLDIAKSLSKSEREANNIDNEKSLIYGEIDFQCVPCPLSSDVYHGNDTGTFCVSCASLALREVASSTT